MELRDKVAQLLAALLAAFPDAKTSGELDVDPNPSWLDITLGNQSYTISYHEGDGFSVYKGITRDLKTHPFYTTHDHILMLARLLRLLNSE